MTNEEKILLADRIIALINDFKTETAPIPKAIGELNIKYGLNGFKPAGIGTPVFEFQGKYLIYLESISGDRSVEVPFNKDTLKQYIKFI